MYLFLAALGLCCCARAFSSCVERELLRCGARASHCSGFSHCRGRAVGAWASVVAAHEHSCSGACGIFPDQESNPCSLRWQADSEPLCHQGSPKTLFFKAIHYTNLFERCAKTREAHGELPPNIALILDFE